MRFKTLKLNSNNTNIYFTADTHFGHKGIIEYVSRPFADIEIMDNSIIDKWNNTINENDIVFHIGDFSLLGAKKCGDYLTRLNGTKYLIAGNHDKSIPEKYFAGVYLRLNLLIIDDEIDDGQRITLEHYPMYSWYQSHRGAWHLHGHVHGGLQFSPTKNYPFPTMYDVGVDNNNYYPVSYEEIKTIITRQILSKKQ